jgi:diaminopimelate decarboxylase
MTFVARVVAIKTVRGHRFALVAGSVHNVKPTGHGKDMPMAVVRRDGAIGPAGPTDVVGYTCMEHDVLTSGVVSGIDVGDFVVYRNVGAYTIVMQPPFIQPAPPILSLDAPNGAVGVFRRRETMDDVFATYRL